MAQTYKGWDAMLINALQDMRKDVGLFTRCVVTIRKVAEKDAKKIPSRCSCTPESMRLLGVGERQLAICIEFESVGIPAPACENA